MNILEEFDTIAAPATPMGAGGVGVIRISGEKAFDIIRKIFSNANFEPRRFQYGWISDGDIRIDSVIVLPFFAPNSYTGENVVEIQCHGGVQVVRNILNLVLKTAQGSQKKASLQNALF